MSAPHAGAPPVPASGLFATFDRILSFVENVAVAIAGVAMIAAMLLVSADAILRYLFNAPITFQQYLTENYLLVAMVNMAFAWGFRMGGYIRIETLIGALPRPASEWVIRIGFLVSAVYVAVLAWTAWGSFFDYWRRGATQFGEIDWPLSWSWVWVPIGCALLALRLVLTAFGPARRFAVGHAGDDPV